MTSRSVTIEFLGKDKSLGATATAVEGKFGKLGGRLDKVGRAAGKLLVGGAVLGAAALYKMGQAAADDEMAQSKLADTLRTGVGATDAQIAATEAWISAQGRALGVTDDELRPALARLATATGDVGEAQRLASIAMDVAAARGVSLQQVTTAMEKAQNGSVGGLGRLGIATKNAAGETLSLEQITAKMAKTYKGAAANAADTTAGKQKKLSVAFAELQEQIGAKVLPVMLKLSQVGLKVVDWIGQNTKVVGIFLGVVGGGLAVLWGISAAMRAWLLITKAWSAATKVAAAVQWVFNAAMAANPIVLVVIAIAALVAGLILAYKKSETFRKIVDGAFRAVGKAVGATVDFIKKTWAKVSGFLSKPVSLAIKVIQAYWAVLKVGVRVLVDVVKKVWAKVTGFLSKPIGLAIRAIQVYWSLLKTGVRVLVGIVKGIWDRMRDILSGPFEAFREVAARVWDGLKAGVRAARDVVVGAFNRMRSIIQGVVDWVQKLIDKIQSIPGIPGGGGAQVAGTAPVSKRGMVGIPVAGTVGRVGAGRSAGGVSVNINGPVFGDPRAFAREVRTALIKEKRLLGTELGLS